MIIRSNFAIDLKFTVAVSIGKNVLGKNEQNIQRNEFEKNFVSDFYKISTSCNVQGNSPGDDADIWK